MAPRAAAAAAFHLSYCIIAALEATYGMPFSGVDGGGATSSHSVPRLSHDATEVVVSPLSPARVLLSRNAACEPSSHSCDGGDTCGTVGGAPPAIAMIGSALR
ncbi:hypothetical protein Vretifemale_15873 [Volvox reticuliferus]|uniref:Secreted protein n=1 Tax=Volvox reticuliferus TaxID=1737510 RepID=A0A8J4CY62_9CHLO|nr:hypothetical protein Vretifemale_15873 [Volvox reticuliferus]